MSGSKIYCYRSNEIRKAVTLLYSQEIDVWHRRVHRNKGDRESNIETTLKAIEADECYVVECDNEVAAFFTIFPSEVAVLNGFHVSKKYRSKQFFAIYWQIIKGFFKDEIYCSLSTSNKAAIDHLKKQGFTEFKTITENETDFIIYHLKL